MAVTYDKLFGRFDSHKPPTGYKFLFYGMAGFSWFGAAFFLLTLFNTEVPVFSVISAAVCALIGYGFFWFYRAYYRKWKAFADKANAEEAQQRAAAKAAFEKEHPHYAQEKFYLKCREAGVEHIDDRANLARMLLLAKENNLTGTEEEMIVYFTQGKNDVEAQEKKARIAELAKKEAELIAKNTKYMDLIGAEKLIQMCLDNAAPYRETVRQCEAELDQLRRKQYSGAPQERESNWAALGGAASALGGTAAGIAVALDAQRENAEIRQRNEARQSAYSEYYSFMSHKVFSRKWDAQKNAEEWEARVEKAKLKLTEMLPEDELLEKMGLTVTKQERSESGAMLLSVSIDGEKTLTIYDNVTAVIDGCFKAILHDDDAVVGAAIFTLPEVGSNTFLSLRGVCPDTGDSQCENYTVTFEPIHLWAIEK